MTDRQERQALTDAAWGGREGAAAYERGRPGYAPEAIATIAEVFRLGPASTILDIGAGTGKLTRQLLATGARVIAVEPIAEMRARLQALLPDVTALEGRAEKLPVPDHSVDLIVAGQAWHWFDGPEAQAEALRVLRPGGGLGLLWNDYDTSVPWTRELGAIRDRHFSVHEPFGDEDAWQSDFVDNPDWEPIQQRAFPHLHQTDRDSLIDRVLSTSVIASLPEAEREIVRQEVITILDHHEETRGCIDLTVPYVTDLFWTTARSSPR